MISTGYVARWKGREYAASPTVEQETVQIRLYADKAGEPGEGWKEVEAGEGFFRAIKLADAQALVHRTTVCEWRGHPFQVLSSDAERLRVEYVGGLTPAARELGLEFIEPGVYRLWIGRNEVENLRTTDTSLY